MDLECHLVLLDVIQLKSIARNLRISTVEKEEPSHSFLVSKITEKLLDYSLTYWIYKDLKPETKKALSQVIYSGKTIYFSQMSGLSGYGICHSSTIPDDLKEALRPNLRDWIIKDYPDFRSKVSFSYYLKAINLLQVIVEEGEFKLNLKRGKSLEKLMAKSGLEDDEKRLLISLVDYYDKKGLVDSTDNILKPNKKKIESWLFSYPANFRELYYEICAAIVPEIFDVLRLLADIQQKESEWVDKEVLVPIIGGGSKAKFEQTGLIEFVELDGVHYVQLTNEGWFFAKGQLPEFWSQKPVLVSAASEVFVPFNYNPLIINQLIPLTEVKSRDYYWVFDIERLQTTEFKDQKTSVISLLERCARRIPETILFEF